MRGRIASKPASRYATPNRTESAEKKSWALSTGASSASPNAPIAGTHAAMAMMQGAATGADRVRADRVEPLREVTWVRTPKGRRRAEGGEVAGLMQRPVAASF